MSIIIQKLFTKKEIVFLLKKLRIQLYIFDYEIGKIAFSANAYFGKWLNALIKK
jgi:hypothetical protein